MNNEPNEPKLLEHEADGIKELDNLLPRWWVWLFNLTTIFAGDVSLALVGTNRLRVSDAGRIDEDRARHGRFAQYRRNPLGNARIAIVERQSHLQTRRAVASQQRVDRHYSRIPPQPFDLFLEAVQGQRSRSRPYGVINQDYAAWAGRPNNPDESPNKPLEADMARGHWFTPFRLRPPFGA